MTPRRKKDFLRLVAYFSLTAIAVIVPALVIGQRWQDRPWGLQIELMRSFYLLVEGSAILDPYLLVVGIILGPLLMMTVDPYKRIHAAIVWVGLGIVGVFVLLPQGLLFRYIPGGVTIFGVGLFVLGLVYSVHASGLTINRLSTIIFERQPQDLKFEAAPRKLQRYALYILSIGLLDAAISYESPIQTSGGTVSVPGPAITAASFQHTIDVQWMFGLLGGGVVIWGLGKFLRYEISTRTVMIGPQRSGKTAAFGGLYASVIEDNPDALFRQAVGVGAAESRSNKIQNGRFPPETQPGEMDPLGIHYDSSGLFREQIKLQTADYAGEKLEEVLDPVLQSDASVSTDGGVTVGPFDADNTSLSDDQDEIWETDLSGGGDGSDSGTETTTDESESFLRYGEASSWEEAFRNLQVVADSGQTDQFVGPAVWNCVEHADRVILTVPFDDFQEEIVKHDNTTDYQPVESAPASDVEQVSTGDEQVFRVGSRVFSEKEVFYQDRTDDEIQVYYNPDRPDRPGPEEYLSWYQSLMRHQKDTEFIVTVTMADLAGEDFAAETQQTDWYLNGSRETFREHVYTLMKEAHPQVANLIESDETLEDLPFILGYRIEERQTVDGTEQVILTDRRPILVGANDLKERLEQ